MSKSVYFESYAKGEWFFQLPCTNAAVTKGMIFRTSDADLEMEVKGAIFRKTSSTGSDVPVLLEIWELATPSTGGVVFSDIPSPLDRSGDTDTGYTVRDNTTFSLVGAKPMFREREFSSRTNISRKLGYDIRYSLKRNTDYLFLNTVESGTDYNVQSVITGLLRRVE